MRSQSRRLRLGLIASTVAAAVVAAAVWCAPAVAGDGGGIIGCDQSSCDLTAKSNGDGGSTSKGGSGGGACHNPQGQVIPCQRNGAWAGGDGCYYAPADVSASTIAALGGQPAGQGGWYVRTCYTDGGGTTQALSAPVWIAGGPPVVSPAVLAREARARLNLPKVVIGLNPPGPQLVNLPVWLSVAASSWRQQSATASVPAFTVTATARPVRAAWAMGDGSTVVCTGPGTPWRAGMNPSAASPDCGYVYRHSSAGAPGGTYTVTVTITWLVTWSGGGQTGTVPGLTTAGGQRVQVQESQTVITG